MITPYVISFTRQIYDAQVFRMTEKKKRWIAVLLLPAAAFLFVSVLRDPGKCSACVVDTLKSLYGKVIPVLFPFMTIAGLFTGTGFTRPFEYSLGRLFPFLYGLPRSAAGAFLLGALCSYPIGPVTVTDLYRKGALSKDEAETGAALASVTGPAFPVAAVGTLLLGNSRSGWLIYSVQILVPLVLGIPFCKALNKRKSTLYPTETKSDRKGGLEVLTEAISSASIRCLTICGTVVIFSLFCDRLIAETGVSGTAAALICSLFEFSEGCRRASVLSGAAAAAICSFAVSCGGLSVIVQSAAAMEKEGLSAVKLAVFKLICGAVSGVIVYLFTSFFVLFDPDVTAVHAISLFEVPSAISFVTLAAVSAGVVIRIRHLILKNY